MTAWPTISVGMVTAHAPDIHAVNVTMRTSGQALGWPVKMGIVGSADGLRIKQRPLPGIGTWGIIAFPYGDPRNGVWLASMHPSSLDAITVNGDKLDPFLDYESHFSGHWQLLDGAGNYAQQFPDGSYMTIASGVGLPATYRHTVDEQQNRQKIAFAHADRVSNVPPPYTMQYVSAAGTQVTVNASGSVTVSGASNALLDFEFKGAFIKVDASGNVNISTPGKINFELNGASASDALGLVSKIVTAWNSHIHTNGNGGANTGTPVTPISASDIQSDLVKTST